MPRLELLQPRRESLGRFRTLACILTAAALGACVPAGRPATAPSPVANRIVVHNYSWDRVTLYLARRGVVWRLGEIDALNDGSFPVPRWALADLDEVYFVARPLAGTSFRSESFVLPSGATAVWTIAAQPAMSHVALR